MQLKPSAIAVVFISLSFAAGMAKTVSRVHSVENLRWPIMENDHGQKVGEVRVGTVGFERVAWNHFFLPIQKLNVSHLSLDLSLDHYRATDLSPLLTHWSSISAPVEAFEGPTTLTFYAGEQRCQWTGPWRLRRVSPGIILGHLPGSRRHPPPAEIYWDGPERGLVLRLEGKSVDPGVFVSYLNRLETGRSDETTN